MRIDFTKFAYRGTFRPRFTKKGHPIFRIGSRGALWETTGISGPIRPELSFKSHQKNVTLGDFFPAAPLGFPTLSKRGKKNDPTSHHRRCVILRLYLILLMFGFQKFVNMQYVRVDIVNLKMSFA
jgi:hypothetical protein